MVAHRKTDLDNPDAEQWLQGKQSKPNEVENLHKNLWITWLAKKLLGSGSYPGGSKPCIYDRLIYY
jgi:hypothetical protein